MNDRQRQLLASLESAFRGIELGGGVSLRETRVLDDYGTLEERRAARARDEKHDWRNVAYDPDLAILMGIAGGMSFFDAEGMRFHLPACLWRAVRDPGGPRVDDMAGCLLVRLAHAEDSPERFALLDDAQRRCVREVLEYLRDQLAFDDEELDAAILGYWSHMQTPP
jgi:hypothetical protein